MYVLWLASVPIGVGVGFWAAQLRSLPYCPPYGRCAAFPLAAPLTFASWQCALFGAGATVVVLLLSLAVMRLPSSTPLKAC
jgi:hypothetical protein